MIRDCTPDDAPAIASLYNHYVLNTSVTFETDAVSDEEMAGRIREVTARLPWLVYEEGGLRGYAYLRPWHVRRAYRHTLEAAVYLAHDEVGKGLGTRLYTELLRRAESIDAHAIVAGIALPNKASIALHEKLGFVRAGVYPEVGRKFGEWIDVGYWHKIVNAGREPE